MSTSNSPCAACKCRRQKCTQECVFAPYFPPDQPQKFINVHNLFGASNIGKLLNELSVSKREDAVNSLAYEAECRLRDPVYGCVGFISILQHKLKQVQHDLDNAKKELATFVGSSSAILPIFQPAGNFIQQHPNTSSMMGLPTATGGQLMICDTPQQQHEMTEPQQQKLRGYEQQQHEFMRFNSGFDNVNATAAFNQMPNVKIVCPSFGMGSYENIGPYHQIQQPTAEHSQSRQLQLQSHELMLQLHQQQPQPHPQAEPQQQLQPQLQRAKSEEGRSVGISC